MVHAHIQATSYGGDERTWRCVRVCARPGMAWGLACASPLLSLTCTGVSLLVAVAWLLPRATCPQQRHTRALHHDRPAGRRLYRRHLCGLRLPRAPQP